MSITPTLCSTIVDTPIGPLTVVATDTALRAVLWPGEPIGRVPLTDVDVCGDAAQHPILGEVARQLEQYFTGDRQQFDVPLDPVGTVFQRSVWMALRSIPYGTTISYGEQAARMGDRRKARAVGAANGRNPISIVVPCHRVVGSTGKLTGFAGGVDVKAWLLDHERRTPTPKF